MTPYIIEKKLKQLVTLILITMVVSFVIQAQHTEGLKSNDEKQGKSSTDSKVLRFRINPAANYTWGYDIDLKNELTIHQPTIPGLPGKDGFKTKEAAQKVAELMVEKIKRGEMFPTVTEEELKKLNTI